MAGYYRCKICGKRVTRMGWKKRLSKTAELKICSSCLLKSQLYEVECPICHKVRKVKTRYALSSTFSQVCLICVKTNYFKSGQYAADKARSVKPGLGIHVNGCHLVPASSGRCEHFTECLHGSHANLNDIPRDQDCLFLVARENWPGFTAKDCHPVLSPDAIRFVEPVREILTVYV